MQPLSRRVSLLPLLLATILGTAYSYCIDPCVYKGFSVDISRIEALFREAQNFTVLAFDPKNCCCAYAQRNLVAANSTLVWLSEALDIFLQDFPLAAKTSACFNGCEGCGSSCGVRAKSGNAIQTSNCCQPYLIKSTFYSLDTYITNLVDVWRAFGETDRKCRARCASLYCSIIEAAISASDYVSGLIFLLQQCVETICRCNPCTCEY